MANSVIIRISWDGPYTLNNLSEIDDEVADYGVYQIYGAHPIYGNDVLLYIGKADLQTFKTRIGQEGWVYNCDSKNVKIYVGRLSGDKTPTANQWSREITLAEKLLIYSHAPARNTQYLNSIPISDILNVHVLNFGNHRSLLPEVSGGRYTDKFCDSPTYDVYGNHKKLGKKLKNIK